MVIGLYDFLPVFGGGAREFGWFMIYLPTLHTKRYPNLVMENHRWKTFQIPTNDISNFVHRVAVYSTEPELYEINQVIDSSLFYSLWR